VYTDPELDTLAEELATREILPSDLRIRARGRPLLGVGPSRTVPVRLDPDLHDALKERADRERTTASDIVRAALREYLAP